jgi:hypothetical protein
LQVFKKAGFTSVKPTSTPLWHIFSTLRFLISFHFSADNLPKLALSDRAQNSVSIATFNKRKTGCEVNTMKENRIRCLNFLSPLSKVPCLITSVRKAIQLNSKRKCSFSLIPFVHSVIHVAKTIRDWL